MPVIFIILALIGLASLVAAYFLKNVVVKTLLCVLSALSLFLFSLALSMLVLQDSLGMHGMWLPLVACGGVFMIGILMVWRLFTPKTRRISAISIAGAVVLVFAVFAGPEIYKRSIMEIPEQDVQLYQYMPFGDLDSDTPSTKVKTLSEVSTLKLTENLPRMDGATALYPLYSAFVRASYPEGNYSPYYALGADDPEHGTLVACSTTPQAFQNLLDGYADVVFLVGVSNEQRAMAEERGLELILTPIGREAFIFFVNSRNTAENLSLADIKRIYAGEVTSWQEVGGGNGAIRAYQRPDSSGSQTMLEKVLDGSPLVKAPEEDVFNLMIGMVKRVASYRNYNNSLGYSFLYYIRDMIGENEVKFLSIDGIPPTRENIESGAYPFAEDFYVVTAKRASEYLNPERAENIDRLIEWILSPQGQYLVDATGYVAVK